MLHPGTEPTREELNEYLQYAIEGRRRVKEQLNKKKPDDEFASINLGYFDANGNLVTVWCPESRNAAATQSPSRRGMGEEDAKAGGRASQSTLDKPPPIPAGDIQSDQTIEQTPALEIAVQPALSAKERHYRIHYGAIGHSYESIFGDYLPGADEIEVEDAYIRQHHQIVNFLRFCEAAVRIGTPKKITLITRFDSQAEEDEAMAKLWTVGDSLKLFNVELVIRKNPNLHDREVRLSNGWKVKIGRGFDIYQKPEDWLHIGATDLGLRPCLETSVDVVEGQPWQSTT
jgi:ATP-dependent Lon protease